MTRIEDRIARLRQRRPDLAQHLDEVLGVDWSNVGRTTLSIVHGVGKGVLSAFGAGKAGEMLEEVYTEHGLLPGTEKVNAQPTAEELPPLEVPTARPSAPLVVTVVAPAFVVLKRKGKAGEAVKVPERVLVTGGDRRRGPGYRPSDPRSFSSVYAAPRRVEVRGPGGSRVLEDVEMAVFGGGVERGPGGVRIGDAFFDAGRQFEWYDPLVYGSGLFLVPNALRGMAAERAAREVQERAVAEGARAHEAEVAAMAGQRDFNRRQLAAAQRKLEGAARRRAAVRDRILIDAWQVPEIKLDFNL